MNLVVNASEAIGDRSGVIAISTGLMECDQAYLREAYVDYDLPPGYFVSLEITDTGCGMDVATQHKLFDPFFSTKSAGHGLGLAAALGIVKAHRGAIRLHSEPGEGTTFKILLPASNVEAIAVKDPIPLRYNWQNKKTVLLVDDE
ncbi:MAG: histidine kinase, partial [Proteobacteria bacterium]|nr:histidine kinase [Pseudomonadota bacterium]